MLLVYRHLSQIGIISELSITSNVRLIILNFPPLFHIIKI